MSSITDALIDSLTESEDFIDKLFANEYFREKIFKLIGKKTKFDNANLENVLWIDKNEYEFITSYEEFVGLSDSDIKKLSESNDFNVYKDFIKRACLEGKIKSSNLVNTHKYGVVEIFIELINNNQIIPNVFEPDDLTYGKANIAYTLIDQYYPTYLNLLQICLISGVKTIDEFFDAFPDNKCIFRSKYGLFVRANIFVNYLKDVQVDIQYIKKLFYDGIPYNAKSIDYFSNVYEIYSYPKIQIYEVLRWFEISGSGSGSGDLVLFKKNVNVSISLYSCSSQIKQIIKNFFDKVCTKPDITDVSDPDYIKYTQIINWLNTK